MPECWYVVIVTLMFFMYASPASVDDTVWLVVGASLCDKITMFALAMGVRTCTYSHLTQKAPYVSSVST